MKKLLITSLFLIFLSCSEKTVHDSKSDHNFDEIEKLKNRIDDLTDQTDQLKSKEDESELQKLREEILALIEKLSEKIDEKLSHLEEDLAKYNSRLSSVEDNYIDKSQYQALVSTIEDEYIKKKDVVFQNGKVVIDVLGKEEILERISELEDDLLAFKKSTSENLKKLDEKWEAKLLEELAKAEKKITKEITQLIEKEISRLNILIQTNSNQMKLLSEQVKNLQNDQYEADQNLKELIAKQIALLEKEISALQTSQDSSQKQIQKIEDMISGSDNSVLVTQIIEKLFKPCATSLKTEKLCYTMGVVINKLGGDFIDPTRFERTKEGLISYLVLSGVNSSAAVENIDSFIISTERSTFEKCFPGQDYLIAPQKYWPHLVLNSILFQKIESVINKRKVLGLVSEDVESPTKFVAWYRNQCYQDDFKRRGLTTASTSDHVYGAAVDVSFRDLSRESFDFYNRFVREDVFERDIFDILEPLQMAKVDVQARHGHGVGGSTKFHLGLLSRNTKGDSPYVIYNY